MRVWISDICEAIKSCMRARAETADCAVVISMHALRYLYVDPTDGCASIIVVIVVTPPVGSPDHFA